MSDNLTSINSAEPAAAAPRPQFQTVILQLSDGRTGYFTGQVLARPTEITILNLQITGCSFTEPGDIPPPTSLPLLVERISQLKRTAEEFEEKPSTGTAKAMTTAQEGVFEVVFGIESATKALGSAGVENGKSV